MFCLQEPGEHPFCGDGIHSSSGLSYKPENLYEHKISFYNFGWRDHQTTEISTLIKIVKTMDYVVQKKKKLAVHCHAGKGRTGLVICAFLLYKNKMNVEQVIELFKKKRKGALKKSSQIDTLKDFYKFLQTNDTNYFVCKNLHQIVESEKLVLPNSFCENEDNNKSIPLFLSTFFNKLFDLVTIKGKEEILKCFIDPICDVEFELRLIDLKNKCKNSSEVKSVIENCNDITLIVQLFLDFLENLSHPYISTGSISSMRFFMKNTDSTSNGYFKQSYYLSTKQVDEEEMQIMFYIKSLLGDFKELSKENYELCVFRLIVALLKLRDPLNGLFDGRKIIGVKKDFNICTIALKEFIDFLGDDNSSQSMVDNISILNSPLRNFSMNVTLNKSYFLKEKSKLNDTQNMAEIIHQFSSLRPDLQKDLVQSLQSRILCPGLQSSGKENKENKMTL